MKKDRKKEGGTRASLTQGERARETEKERDRESEREPWILKTISNTASNAAFFLG